MSDVPNLDIAIISHVENKNRTVTCKQGVRE